jgi:hypothetical protein
MSHLIFLLAARQLKPSWRRLLPDLEVNRGDGMTPVNKAVCEVYRDMRM